MTRTAAQETSRTLREGAPAWPAAALLAAHPSYAMSTQAGIRLHALEPPR